jgi:type II secretory ATPase GspE/PulE/Tfp pilus assembly ATPase PilB-like protein
MVPARTGTHYISEILLAAGVVTEQHIAAALAQQGRTGQRMGEALVELGAATENDIGWALARQFGYTFLDLSPEALDAELVASFPEGLLRRLQVVPLVRTESSLSAGFGDPTDQAAVAELERVSGMRIEPYVVAPSKLLQALDRLEGARHDGHRRTPSSPLVAHRGSVSRERSGEPLLAGHLRRAMHLGASEIHFVPVGEEMRVFHRVGPRLVGAGSGPASLIDLLLARLEALGGPAFQGELKHASGRAVCPLDGQHAVLDVSLAGTEAGLAITLRLRTSDAHSLEQLGLDPVDLAGLRGVLEQPSGLAFVTGPSHSGRTTTLASLLAAVPMETRRSAAFEGGGGAALPSPSRFAWAPDQVRSGWRELVVGQAVDVVAVDDVFTGEHAAGALAADASGRFLLATTDWCDGFALIDFLASRPGGSQVLAERLRLVIQQRMASFEPEAGGAKGTMDRRPVLEVLFVSEAMRAALRDGAPASRLRQLAAADQHRTLAERLHGLVAAGRLSPAEAARIAA